MLIISLSIEGFLIIEWVNFHKKLAQFTMKNFREAGDFDGLEEVRHDLMLAMVS